MEKIAKRLVALIEQIDYWRPQKEFFMGRMKYRIVEFSLTRIMRYDPDLGKEIYTLFNTHKGRLFKEHKIPNKEFVIFFIALILYSLTMFIIAYFGIFFNISLSMSGLFLIISIYLAVGIRKGIKIKDAVGKEQEPELKSHAQKIIDYTRRFLEIQNLNPKEFSIELRHNDYEGLVYEGTGKGFIAYFKI